MAAVLIVEDDPANREVFRKILAGAGHEVTTAINGVAALAKLAKYEYEVIVCDIKMPELSGRGFYEQLEELYPAMASRVVFVTAFAEDASLQDFFRAAGQPLLPKPVDIDALVGAVGQVAAHIY